MVFVHSLFSEEKETLKKMTRQQIGRLPSTRRVVSHKELVLSYSPITVILLPRLPSSLSVLTKRFEGSLPSAQEGGLVNTNQQAVMACWISHVLAAHRPLMRR